MGKFDFVSGTIAFLVAFVLFVLPVLGLISAFLFDTTTWEKAGFSRSAKWLWIVLLLVLGAIGALGYFIGVRPKLRRVQS